ncbi:MAG TPA: Xaa-Pro aminopeptidase [Pyrinomonadaceae bacterium]|jgi:Xaa-Pro aminopeptidase|nr:Xaa-Pro aminopeptidase [Pyrinomonadaceae bacterium]
MKLMNSRSATLCATLVAVLLNSAIPLIAGEHSPESFKSSVIRMAPPAPVFDEKTRLTELAGRRARVGQSVGEKGVLILFSTEPRVYANDVDYEYRQENNLYYLTNLKQKGATLVLTPSNEVLPEILFLPRRSPAAETWTGHMYSPEEASQVSGIKEIWDASEFEPFLRALRSRQPYRPKAEKILMSANAVAEGTAPFGFQKLFAAAAKNDAEIHLLVPGAVDSLEYRQEQRFAAEWAKSSSGYSIKDVTPVFASLRLRKSPFEIALMQHAIDITTEAHERAWVAAVDAKWEYEVDAQVAYTFKLRNADHWGYPSIVGCGPNATTLHYEESQGQVTPGELLLMDVGAEYDHYSADVTRTFPVNGKFSTAQAEIYQIVYDAQEAGAAAARPSAVVSDVNRAATEVIRDGLLKLGLITNRNSDQYRVWFMHGTSHWLGMNVHDVGFYGTKLEAGMVFTNEPGIYIRPDALDNLPKTPENEKFIAAVKPAFEKYKSIGVRIEDDMLITPTGVRWMTEALPRKISEIEDFIARGRRETR